MHEETYCKDNTEYTVSLERTVLSSENTLLPPKEWSPPIGWQSCFTLEELQSHPGREAIFQRITHVNQEIERAQKAVHEPKKHVVQTTGFGVDWEDVEHQARRAFGRKLLGE